MKCGTFWTKDCLGKSDKRYDPNSSINLIDQHPFYKHYVGLYNSTLTGTSPGFGVVRGFPYDEKTGEFGKGPLYNYENFISFRNITVVGSRLYLHSYTFFPPVPLDLCNGSSYSSFLPPTNDTRNLQDDDTVCGINGRVLASDGWYHSSYEKDGTAIALSGTGLLGPSNIGGIFPVTENMIQISTRDSKIDPITQNSGFQIFFDNYKKIATKTGVFNFRKEGSPLVLSNDGSIDRVEDEKLLFEQMSKVIEKFNITQKNIPAFPMQTECIFVDECITEEQFCEVDPSCSLSPYQEPGANLKNGVIACIVIGVVLIITAALYMLHLFTMKKEKEKIRQVLIKGIAGGANVGFTQAGLTMDDLVGEFKKIDMNDDGLIQKSELKKYAQSGKFGELSEKDFARMFQIIDKDGSGEIDFIEFVTIIGQCPNKEVTTDANLES
mmetsp:Transcript_1390/g.1589  ORF Transcript_1390/g.1589 Transcript_1390/m.1589 type:complete len:438 (-) Transcript_1390:57-1370(-)|eukprot:CAMPEP_0194146234 /NCGR_PEP_ID=MMETSP0152-20130528/20470_1 /TAXON_ID=1049557 /ORGANISM="Thalassiothrix antarctica, Strain L6-D1" /LENGTH=437 /DNA_ID=CAMNT_0038846713 /DNA_START=45 /DNA_END=1358 /DNA_ORIENTATION=-